MSRFNFTWSRAIISPAEVAQFEADNRIVLTRRIDRNGITSVSFENGWFDVVEESDPIWLSVQKSSN